MFVLILNREKKRGFSSFFLFFYFKNWYQSIQWWTTERHGIECFIAVLNAGGSIPLIPCTFITCVNSVWQNALIPIAKVQLSVYSWTHSLVYAIVLYLFLMMLEKSILYKSSILFLRYFIFAKIFWEWWIISWFLYLCLIQLISR